MFGLYSYEQDNTFILEAVNITGTVIGSGAEITIKQVYHNTYDQVIQSTEYRFPLDENSAVSGFQAEFDGKVLVGQVKEKTEAKQEYTHAVRSGKRASLLEQQRDNDFKCHVGNIPAKGKCVITISYITTLDQRGMGNVLTLPISMAPKYGEMAKVNTPMWDETTPHVNFACDGCDMRPICGERFHCKQCVNYDLCKACHDAKVHFPVTHTFLRLDPFGALIVQEPIRAPRVVEGNVRTKMTIQLTCKHIQDPTVISCNSKQHDLVKLGNDYLLSTEGECASHMDDFELYIRYGHAQEAIQSQLVVEKDSLTDQVTATQLTFVPTSIPDESAAMTLQSEYIFLLDCSGSMEGPSMVALQKVMQLILHQLPVKCKFNCYFFGSMYTKLFPKSVFYTDETLAAAKSKIETMSANMNGTEIMEPLKDALTQSISKTYPRQVFLVTDGQVSYVQELNRLIHDHIASTRVFTIGIGGEVDRNLIKQLAVSGHGSYEFVTASQDMNAQVIRQLGCANQPCFLGTSINWNQSGTMTTVPQQIPALYANAYQRVFVYGLSANGFTLDPNSEVVITTHSNVAKKNDQDDKEGLVIYKIPYSDVAIHETSTGVISKLAARARIRELEYKNNKTPADNDLIKTIALQHQLMSTQTSFIVVDQHADAVTTNTETPVMIMKNTLFVKERTKSVGLSDDEEEEEDEEDDEEDCAIDSICMVKVGSVFNESNLVRQSAPVSFSRGAKPASSNLVQRCISSVSGLFSRNGGGGAAASNKKQASGRISAHQNSATRGMTLQGSGLSRSIQPTKKYKTQPSPQETYLQLIGLQKTDGYFKINDPVFMDILTSLSTSFDQVREKANKTSQSYQEPFLSDDVLGIVIALAILRNVYLEKKAEWIGIMVKSVYVLNKSVTQEKTISELQSTLFQQ